MRDRVLLVDDEQNVLDAHRRNLGRTFTLDVASGAADALRLLEEKGPYAVVVSDMQMPGMNGLELLAAVKSAAPETIRMMLTGNADLETAMRAVNDGNVFRFITKPCDKDALVQFVRAGIHQYRLVVAERELLERTLSGAVKLCTELIAASDPRAAGVSATARDVAGAVAKTLALGETWELELATMLATIGRATVPPVVIVRERSGKPLSGVEKDMLERVPEIGHQLLSGIPRLEHVARIVLYARKHFDGSGIPRDAIAGERIPIESRILKAAYDFVVREQSGESAFEALNVMQSMRGCYDPAVLEALYSIKCAAKVDFEPQAIAFEDLSIGHVLASPIETSDGVLLVAARTVVSKALYERLTNFARIHEIREPVFVVPRERAIASVTR